MGVLAPMAKSAADVNDSSAPTELWIARWKVVGSPSVTCASVAAAASGVWIWLTLTDSTADASSVRSWRRRCSVSS
jgi:hypothetical protein